MTEYGGSPDRDPDRLVRDYADLVMRVCYTYLRSTADAEDVCQDTLVKLVFRAEPFRDLGHERAWVVRVAINACKNLLRDRGAHPTAALDAVPEPAADPTPDEGALLAREGEVLAAVMALPLPQREAVYLHYYEGLQRPRDRRPGRRERGRGTPAPEPRQKEAQADPEGRLR